MFDQMIHKARAEGNVQLEQFWLEAKAAHSRERPRDLQSWLQARVDAFRVANQRMSAEETLEALKKWGR
jgi:hypothetical protein